MRDLSELNASELVVETAGLPVEDDAASMASARSNAVDIESFVMHGITPDYKNSFDKQFVSVIANNLESTKRDATLTKPGIYKPCTIDINTLFDQGAFEKFLTNRNFTTRPSNAIFKAVVAQFFALLGIQCTNITGEGNLKAEAGDTVKASNFEIIKKLASTGTSNKFKVNPEMFISKVGNNKNITITD